MAKKVDTSKPRATKTLKSSAGSKRTSAAPRKTTGRKPFTEEKADEGFKARSVKKTVRRSPGEAIGERPVVRKKAAAGTTYSRKRTDNNPERKENAHSDTPGKGVEGKKKLYRGGTERFSRDADAKLSGKKFPDRNKTGYTQKRAKPSGPSPAVPEYNLKKYADSRKKKTPARAAKTETNGNIRLNRYIANAGICSRRDADLLIQAGEIKVNGKVVTEMGYQVSPQDTVKYGNRVLNPEKPVYMLLNKPKDFITTMDDPDERKTVMDLVKDACPQRIYPVGRLDRNTTGLLLLTNDGELAEKLAHPSNKVKKIYQVDLNKAITKNDFQRIVDGVELEDGIAYVNDLAVLSEDKKTLGIEIHIGRNRVVRRIFEHLGYEVVKLDRVMYAGLTKQDLPRGKWRFLTEKEVIRLKYML